MSEPSEKVVKLVEELKKRTQMESYALKVKPGVQPGLTDSKFGGLPYWDLTKPYPEDGQGNKLYLLAQINFDLFHVKQPLPQSGMLQFFLADDDVFGMDFDHPDVQSGFRVIYHPAIDQTVTPEQVKALGVPTHADVEYTPVFQEAALELDPTAACIGLEDRLFDDLAKQLVKELFGEDVGDQNLYRYLGSDDFDYLCEQCQPIGHHLLGYPYFTQYDPRPEDSPYDTLLFQMDSDMVDHEDVTLWGDCGVANFFINGEDLKNLEFSRVLYNWDCC